MAKKIIAVKVRKGKGVLVENQDPRFGAATKYVNFYLSIDGRPGECLMFTEAEVKELMGRPNVLKQWNFDDGDFIAASINGYNCYIGRVNYGRSKKVVKLTNRHVVRGRYRAANNPEDVTKPSWLTKVFGRLR